MSRRPPPRRLAEVLPRLELAMRFRLRARDGETAVHGTQLADAWPGKLNATSIGP